MRAATLALLASAAIAAGCGASEEEAAIEGVVERHLGAIADGDGKAACRDLTAEAKRLVVISFEAAAPGAGARTCEDAFEAVAANLDDAGERKLRDSDHRVEVRGDGTATVDSSATTGEIELREQRGRWVITRVNFGS